MQDSVEFGEPDQFELLLDAVVLGLYQCCLWCLHGVEYLELVPDDYVGPILDLLGIWTPFEVHG
jgi:hypothetical protein